MVLLFLLSAVIALAEQSIEASVGPFPNLFFSGMTITALISSACSDVEKLWIPVAGGGQGGVETAWMNLLCFTQRTWERMCFYSTANNQ